jgi:D-glycero-alpha-D-manno-heptose 1-phosphate guanylyltransferase
MTSPSDWTALILAGGFGTRLQRVVPDRQKPMAPVAGRPFVEFPTAPR